MLENLQHGIILYKIKLNYRYQYIFIKESGENRMKNYEKPMVLANEELAEGVYAASGSDCYTVTYNIHQAPQEGRGDYRIQVDATHAAADNHHSGEQILILTFNLPVTYVSSNGTLLSGDGSTCLNIKFTYHNNASEYIGLGDVVVTADPGLTVNGAELQCNLSCSQH